MERQLETNRKIHQVAIKKIHPNAKFPSRQTEGSAGYDIQSCMDEPITIAPGAVRLIPTGIAVSIPEGMEIQVRPRSGMSSKNRILIINSPGTIDSDYRGEIFVPMMNLGEENFTIEPGMRIAQLILAKVESIEWIFGKDLDETLRGDKGFGSSGT